MFIPRFSIRWLLLLMSGCALLAYVVSLALAGHVWAIALSASIAMVLLMGALQATVFCLAWAFAMGWRGTLARRRVASPFAMHTPPPQLITPDEPD